MKSKAQTFMYAVYLLVVTLIGLEASLRIGVLKFEAYTVDHEIRSAPPGRRLLILGDSFAEERPESFGTLLRERLKEEGVVTLNLARSGAGPLRYMEMLKLYGLKFHPDLVFVGYFTGNDLSGTSYSVKGIGQRVRLWLSRSYLGEAILEARANLLIQRRLKAIGEDSPREAAELPPVDNPFLIELSRSHPDYLMTNLLIDTPAAQESWELNKAILLEMNQLTESNGGHLLIGVFPCDVQIYEQRYEFYRQVGLVLDRRFLSTSVPQDLMMGFCRAQGIACIDLLADFRAHPDEDLYRERDLHWNQAGDRLAFERVRQFIDAELH